MWRQRGLGSVLLGEVGKELKAIIRGEEVWKRQRCHGPPWRPELREARRGAGARVWWRAGGLCSTPRLPTSSHLLPCLLLHYTSSASSLSRGAQGCTATSGAGLRRGDKIPRFSRFTRTAGPKLPGTLPVVHCGEYSLGQKTSGALYWQFCVNHPIAQSRCQPIGPEHIWGHSSGVGRRCRGQPGWRPGLGYLLGFLIGLPPSLPPPLTSGRISLKASNELLIPATA